LVRRGDREQDTFLVMKAVRMVGISKRYPGVLANDRIDFEAEAGEVHALLGENGAGKTTLMKVLYGLVKPDEGEIYVYGRRARIRSPKDAIRLGISMVHQDFKLVPALTVVENILLGLPEPKLLIKYGEVKSYIRGLAKRYGIEIDLDAKVNQLSVGEKQKIEILRALCQKAKILILDEPTSVLTPLESKNLFRMVRRMKEEGKTVIYITHKLGEVYEICDRVTVLRKGRRIATLNVSDVGPRELAVMMVGELPEPRFFDRPSAGRIALKLVDVSAYDDRGLLALKDVSMVVREGEIVGIAGMAGSGQKELSEVIAGLRKPFKGSVTLFGEDVTGIGPRRMMEKGVAYIPEDRMEMGLVPSMKVEENLMLRSYRYPPYSNGFLLNLKEIRSSVNSLINRFGIVATPETLARNLSGGNTQRLLLARELSHMPRLIVACYPTRGLDVRSANYVKGLLLEHRNRGAAIVLISEDLEELLEVSDRILVMREGRIVGEVKGELATAERLGMLMGG